MDLDAVNWMALVVSALSAFALGALWYGPLFGKAWQDLADLSDEDIKHANPATTYGGALVLNLVTAFGMSMVMQLHPAPGLGSGISVGAVIGLAFVATAFGINYLFARKSLRLYFIDAGYMVTLLTIMGAVIGAWR